MRVVRFHLALLSLLVIGLSACAATPPATTRASGSITYEHEQRKGPPPMHLHVVRIDLTDPAVHVVVRRAGEDPDGEGEWETTLLRTSQIAERDHLDVAVNGDFFHSKDVLVTPIRKVPYYVGNWAWVCGPAMSDGKLWSTRPAPASLLVDDQGRVTIGRLGGPPPVNIRQIVSGMSLVVERGQNTGAVDPPAPHTVAGIDKEGKTLTLLVVDGRRPEYSAGMTLRELGEEMLRLGCWSAIQLDGGGSTTLVMYDPDNDRYNVINRPSDGHDLPLPISVERAVANVLGVKVDKKPGRGAATKP
jgi:exopolysaccharide biosynthesis protein